MLGTPSFSRRALVVVALAALVVTSATACDAGVPAAGKVNGHVVTRDQLFLDLKAEAAAAKKAGSAAAQAGNALSSPAGATPGTYTTVASAAALTNRIVAALYSDGLALLGGKVTTADNTAAKNTLCADATTGQAPTDGSCPALADYTPAYRAFLIDLQARKVAYSNAVARKAYPQIKAKAPDSLRQVCLEIVQVLDANVARQVQLGVAGGKTLAAAAAEVAPDASGNPQVGQQQSGCLFLNGAPPELAKASVGEAVPVENNGATFVASITSFATADEEAFIAQPPTNDAAVAKILAPIAQRVLDGLHVAIDPRFGHWDEDNLAVVAPEGPAAAGPTTTAPATGLIPANP